MSETIHSAYQTRQQEYTERVNQLNLRHRIIGMLRLLIALLLLLSLYGYFRMTNPWMLLPPAMLFIGFFLMLRIHQQIRKKRDLAKTLAEINETEQTFLAQDGYPFEDGKEFTAPGHAYAADLDLFGRKSLFQYLNRTATYPGKRRLAALLSDLLPSPQITENQEAIRELSGKIDWRQHFYAYAKLSGDNPAVYEQLHRWAAFHRTYINGTGRLLSFLLPGLFLVTLALYVFTDLPFTGDIAFLLFSLNLYLSYAAQKKAAEELIRAHKIDELISDYGLLLATIESEAFKSSRLQTLQQQLQNADSGASREIKNLSALFSRVEHVQNLIGGLALNGVFQYHIHTLIRLANWKKAYANSIPSWLGIIGEFEALGSLANFSFNNPDYVFPQLNEHHRISFTDLGHPLISGKKRVCNSLSFQPQRFLILTGSNMSGKSTFLRTLGIAMVLAGIGAPVCARSADVHPLPVFVSMGQTDSLADNESYFFAEVKRLKYIIDALDQQICFVLLDEILRGTNSDDKRNGTIGVIEKIIQQKAIGAIATHDLEVCGTTRRYPDILTNKCFEVTIQNNELSFDYRLREGICHNQSATFLMKKMNIIP